MDPNRWKAVNRIFHAALEIPASDRETFVSRESIGDRELEQDVIRLLKADSEAESYLETPFSTPSFESDVLPSPFSAGEIIKKRFRIERHVGQGGMGHVFEAFDLDLGVRVALKVIRPEIASNPAALEYFRREVRTARTITHTNVCRTYDFDKVSTDRNTDNPRELYFLTMEFLEGETLAARIRREGPLTDIEARVVARQIAAGLNSAHAAGIIHRDLKPGNIMLVPSNPGTLARAVIMDFGLARGDRAAQEESAISHGALVGTLAYMAPEQLYPGQQISDATDVYAFGLLLFEIVTGKQAYPATDLLSGITQRLSGPPPSAKKLVPDLPEAWEQAIQGCLRPEPGDRFESGAAVVAVLNGERSKLLRRQRPPNSASNRRIRLLLRPWSVSAFVALVLVSLLLACYRLYQQRRDSEVTAGALLYLSPVLNHTRERGLDNLTELLEAGLSQSVQINLLDQSRVGDTLQLMAKLPDTSITEPIAREIAMRTGAVRVVIPTVSGSNGSFTLHIDIQQPDNTPVRYRDHWTKDFSWNTAGVANANGATIPSDLMLTIRKATDWIRHETGESRNDIARLDTPPENVTTDSWEALQEITKAADYSRLGRREEAISSLQAATRYDHDCALAYARIGDLRIQSGHLEEGITAYLTALDLGSRNRLSERERDYIRGIFALDTGNYQAAEDAFRDYSALYGEDYSGWFYRALPLSMLGRFDEASRVLEKAHEVAPKMIGAVAMLVDESLIGGDLKKAEEWNSKLRAIPGSGDAVHFSDAQIAIFKGNFGAAKEAIDQLGNSAEPVIRAHAARYQAHLAAEQGDYSEAARILSQAIQEYGPEPLLFSDRAHAECLLRELSSCLDDIEKATEGDSSPQMLLRASETLGQTSQSEPKPVRKAIVERLSMLERKLPSEDVGVLGEDAKHRLHGETLFAEGQFPAALEEFRKSDSLEAPYVGREYLGRSFERAALSERDPRRACESVRSALHAYAVSALHPAIIWELHDQYPPGYYAENLFSWLELSAPEADANSEYGEALRQWSFLRRSASLPQRSALLSSCSTSF